MTAVNRSSGGLDMTALTATKTALLTSAAMIAFAANSLLCRMALGGDAMDAASFTNVRLAAGALTLWLIVHLTGSRATPARVDWIAAAMLFAYAVAFSFAYVTLSTGTGALILFGAVQATMLVAGLRAGETLPAAAWAGLALAVAGLVYLVSPGLAAPSPSGAALMAAAGIAWGIYSLRGRGQADPLRATALNFACAAPLALLANLAFLAQAHVSTAGIALAAASGALASGIGYAIWYAALRGLQATRAAVVQLTVPVIAAFGGIVLLAEDVTLRLVVSSAAVLGGIALVLSRRSAADRPAAQTAGRMR